MEEVIVTRLWMGGVVAMMGVFALIATVGYIRKKKND